MFFFSPKMSNWMSSSLVYFVSEVNQITNQTTGESLGKGQTLIWFDGELEPAGKVEEKGRTTSRNETWICLKMGYIHVYST